jgi:tricorn protease
MLLSVPVAQAQSKPLRFPDVHGDRVVFSYGADLWTASTSGGLARRLTAHPGIEYFAKYSPDGKWIAFTGQYDGDEQVYVMPADGGEPRQLTFYPAHGPNAPRHGYDNQVYGWTRDGKAVLFRSRRDANGLITGRLYTVPLDGGLPTALPMPDSGAGAYSPDGKKIVYSPQFRDFRTEKRYEGGWANRLYIYDLASAQAELITHHVRADRDPMWIGDKIYYSSDRDGTLNLYSYDPASRQNTELTHSKQWDIRWPSASSGDDGQIVYELNGELQIFDTRTGKDKKITIEVPDDGLNRRPSWVSAANQIEDFALSPKGERALIVARGDVFTAPIEKGPTRNLTNSSNAHDKWARWSPDGRKIAFISDRSGEEEVCLINQDGAGDLEQITTEGHRMRFAPEWAPDGKKLAFSDKEGRMFVLTIADKKLTEIAHSVRGEIRDYTWAPDSGYVAFSMNEPNQQRAIYIWSSADGQTRKITDEYFNATEPVWDPDGNYLWYLADHQFEAQLGGVELEYLSTRRTGIFALALRKDVKHPFPPESDEVAFETEAAKENPPEKDAATGEKNKEDAKRKEEPKKEEPKKKEPLKIDFEGLGHRVVRVPVSSENYQGLTATKGNLIYMRQGDFYLGREATPPTALVLFSIKDRKETVIADDVERYALSQDGNKIIARQGGALKLFDVASKGKEPAKTISTAGLMVDRVPTQEWTEIFEEVWRRYRDFFYVPNMHGYDWKALHDQYRPLAEKVAHRSDLNYVVGEMIAELSVGHAYIEGGDFQIPPRPRVALPGARFALDRTSNRYRIAQIYRGQNEEERYRSPLTEVGVDVREGDYVLAIDGEELKGNQNPYKLLRNKADRNVEVTVNSKPALEGARKISYRPITDESPLLYLDWVRQNREKVEKATGGRVGYIHIPDMGENGMREFIKNFYPQIRKEGMVVDVRANGGGFVSQLVIERLRRELIGTEFGRDNVDAGTYPSAVFHGSLVCLLNETSASDGDIFPYMFRRAGLGPLIGKRSWGGVVGITGHGPLIDGGTVYVPESATASEKGEWIIEGHGVDPDIVVENDAASVIAGRDPQLERGIAEVLKRMNENPKKLPTWPAAPVKTKRAE